MTVLDTKITISKRESNKGGKYINIAIKDDVSGICFAEVKISLEDFAEALTGLGYVECKTEVRGLHNIGKEKEYERASVFITDEEYACVLADANGSGYDAAKTALGEWLEENHAREGWSIDKYLGSQGSIKYVDDGKMLNFGYYRYIDKSKED